ncbi:MAG: M14 family zinc carboxypeptidase, partial [Bacteroidota bacterium]
MKSIKLFLFIALLISTNTFASSKQKILTTAEKTNFESTSRYSEVIDFFKQLKKISPNNIRIESLAKSIEGRDVPLIIIGKPLPKLPKDIAKDKRIVIYVQANIHAGEVEGKEAIQMIARDILLKETPDYLKNVVLLICPIFNSDGNEQI